MKDVIIALDFPDRAKTLGFLDRFTDRKPFVKVGMELFYAEGHSLVEEIKRRGHNIFLDLKLHDIPNTVGSAMKVIGELGVDMVNVHAAGGRAMMKAAAEGLALSGHKTILIAVTQLTSTSQEMLENELLISKPIEEVIAHYARNAKAAGRSLLAARSRYRQRGVWKRLPRRYARYTIRRQRQQRPSTYHHTRRCSPTRSRLYRSGTPHYQSRRPCGSLPEMCRRLFGIKNVLPAYSDRIIFTNFASVIFKN